MFLAQRNRWNFKLLVKKTCGLEVLPRISQILSSAGSDKVPKQKSTDGGEESLRFPLLISSRFFLLSVRHLSGHPELLTQWGKTRIYWRSAKPPSSLCLSLKGDLHHRAPAPIFRTGNEAKGEGRDEPRRLWSPNLRFLPLLLLLIPVCLLPLPTPSSFQLGQLRYYPDQTRSPRRPAP